MAQEALIMDYFYGDESEQFSYFRIPRLLITSPRFKGLSTDAKLLYGIPMDNGQRELAPDDLMLDAEAGSWTPQEFEEKYLSPNGEK